MNLNCSVSTFHCAPVFCIMKASEEEQSQFVVLMCMFLNAEIFA